jgi:hypothetical protein
MSESSKAYRRGTPYKAPEEASGKPSDIPEPRVDALAEFRRQEARLRRGLRILIGVTILALVIIVTTGVVVVWQVKEQAGPAANPGKNTITPKGNVEPGPGGKAETQRERFLATLNNLTQVHLYQSYLNIGLLADSTESEVYTSEETQKWLDRTVGQLEAVDKQLDALARLDLDAEERKGIERCRSISGLLRTQATELREYWKKSDKDHAMRYHKARDAAWARLSEVLQIVKEPE